MPFWSSLFAAVAACLLTVVPACAEEEEDASILDSVSSLAGLKTLRDAAADRGFRFSGFYFFDPRANLHGGMREGGTYSGLLKLRLDIDGETVFGVEGGRLHADMLQIHGADVSDEYVGNILSANDIGAVPTTRLFELYWEQEIGERLTVKLGQLAADEEFKRSDHAETFIGATLGWAASPSENLPQGGPAYPLAALGFQAAYRVSDAFTLIGAVYNGTTAPPGSEDPERANRHGLDFRLGDPPLVILEGRYRYNEGENAGGLPGQIKLGGYAYLGHVDDLKYGRDGLVLGSAGGSDDPRRRDGTINLYAIVDQQIWRAPGGDEDDGIGLFARTIVGDADRNPINVYVDGGLVAKGIVPGRPADVIGLAAAYANFSPRLRAAERAAYAAEGARGATSRFEAIVEATYKAQIVPGLTVQPTLQYVMRPNGGPPEDGGRRIPNATIFGVTTVVTF